MGVPNWGRTRALIVHACPHSDPTAEGSILSQLEVLYDGLCTLESPALDPFCDDSSRLAVSKRRMVSDAEARELLQGVQDKVIRGLKELSASNPHLTESGVNFIIDDLLAKGIVMGGWDKKLFSLYGVCSKVLELRTLHDVFLGSRFNIWGWGEDAANAAGLALSET